MKLMTRRMVISDVRAALYEAKGTRRPRCSQRTRTRTTTCSLPVMTVLSAHTAQMVSSPGRSSSWSNPSPSGQDWNGGALNGDYQDVDGLDPMDVDEWDSMGAGERGASDMGGPDTSDVGELYESDDGEPNI